jgi:hypothetical protein
MKAFHCAICGKLIEREVPENGESVGEYVRDDSRLCWVCAKKISESD